MWAVSYSYLCQGSPLPRHIPNKNPIIKPHRSLSQSQLAVSATNSQPQRHQNKNDNNANNAIGGLDRTILTSLHSNPTTVQTPHERSKPSESDGQGGAQISGSDVLWAMRKVADKKNKRRKKKGSTMEGRESLLSSAGSRREEPGGGDCESEIRPLVVKTEWALKLNELEKRLNDLSQTK